MPKAKKTQTASAIPSKSVSRKRTRTRQQNRAAEIEAVPETTPAVELDPTGTVDPALVVPAPEPPPTKTFTIRDRAMLVNLTVSEWSGYCVDRPITSEVHKQHSINDGMGDYYKTLIAKETLSKVHRAAQAIRYAHHEMTLAWDNKGGTRILASKAFPEYNAKLRKLIADFEQTFEEELGVVDPQTGLSGYEAAKIEAKTLLNGAYRETDYPSFEQLRLKYGARITVLPIPAGEDFRIDLGAEATEQIRQEIEANTQEHVAAAMKGLYQRLHEVVSALVRTLKGEKVEAIRQTLLKSIGSVLDTLPMLNITQDETLDEFAAEIRSLITGLDASKLRAEETHRIDVARKADEILTRMNDFLG